MMTGPLPPLVLHGQHHQNQSQMHDDNLIKLEASQDELEGLDKDAVSIMCIDTSHKGSHLQKHLQKKENRKAQKLAKIA